MKIYGLIGKPLGHSDSAKLFNAKFAEEAIDAQYQLFPLDSIDDLDPLLTAEQRMVGLNVTIPYKVQILRYVDGCDRVVQRIGAANVLKIVRDQTAAPKLKAYNTDWLGFAESLKPFIAGAKLEQALIFGSGGASRAVAYALDTLGIAYRILSRSPKGANQLSYQELSAEELQRSKLLINATPLGMHPDTDRCPPIDYEQIDSDHYCYDLIYKPAETLFLAQCKARGAQVKNGLEMLKLQALAAWKIWNE